MVSSGVSGFVREYLGLQNSEFAFGFQDRLPVLGTV